MAYLAMNGSDGAEQSNTIARIWNNYVNLETFQEDESNQREIDMQEEYKLWVGVKAKLVKTKEGKYTVTGIPAKI